MAKPAPAPRDGVTVVIPVHNAVAQVEKMLPAWGLVLGTLNRPFQILVVNDGSTDGTASALEKLGSRVPNLRTLKHDTPRGFGACLRTALAEATQPLLMYAGIDGQYTPTDIRPMLERIELRDEIFGKQPDLISGFRAGQPRPALVKWLGGAWKVFWRVFAGLPITDSPPWYGWDAWWYRTRTGWVYGVPLADVNSAFKLYRTAFLKRFPIQSDGDFVHAELVAKATFLTSIMDEVPLTPKSDPHPPLGPVSADRAKVWRHPEFAFKPEPPPKPSEPPALVLESQPKPTEPAKTPTEGEVPQAPKSEAPPAPAVQPTPIEPAEIPTASETPRASQNDPVASKSEPAVEQSKAPVVADATKASEQPKPAEPEPKVVPPAPSDAVAKSPEPTKPAPPAQPLVTPNTGTPETPGSPAPTS